MLDKDREKTPEERWSYDLRNTPSVKFQVIMLADNDPDSKALGMATIDRTFIDIGDVYKQFVGAVTPMDIPQSRAERPRPRFDP